MTEEHHDCACKIEFYSVCQGLHYAWVRLLFTNAFDHALLLLPSSLISTSNPLHIAQRPSNVSLYSNYGWFRSPAFAEASFRRQEGHLAASQR
jgi:hypothetical protein